MPSRVSCALASTITRTPGEEGNRGDNDRWGGGDRDRRGKLVVVGHFPWSLLSHLQ